MALGISEVKTPRRPRANRQKPVLQAQRRPSELWVFALLTAAVFAATGRRCGLVSSATTIPAYVTDNVYVNAGVTWNGIVWAFTHSSAATGSR